MAVSSIVVPPDPKRDARALVLSGQVGSWPRFVLKQPWGTFEAGTVFRRATGKNGRRYLVNSVACQCPDYAEAGFVCKHVRAHAIWEAGQQPASTAPNPHPPADGDTDTVVCVGCGHQVSAMDDIAAVDDPSASDGFVIHHVDCAGPVPAPTARPSYADLFPPCRGCGDLADSRDGFCDRCASNREWQARRAV